MRAGLFAGLACVVAASAACGDSGEGGDSVRTALRDGVPSPLPPPPHAPGPEEPNLPACLSGDSPSGCAEAPLLADCLVSDDPRGCAAPPQLEDWSCAAGWTPTPVGEGESWQHTQCRVGMSPDCAPGTIAVAGETACSPVGTQCPTETFLPVAQIRAAAPEHPGAILYVAPGGSGDGTFQAPLGNVADALALAASGDIVALAAGTFDQPLVLDKGVAVVGSCVTGTTLTTTSPSETEGVVGMTAGDNLLANLRVSGPRVGIQVAPGAGTTVVRDVEVIETEGEGIRSESTTSLTLESVAVRGTRPWSVSQENGFGLRVYGGTTTARRLVLEDNHTWALQVSGSSTVMRLSESAIRDTQSEPASSNYGLGVVARDGASLTLERSVVERNRSTGVIALDAGTSVLLTDVEVRETESEELEGLFGRGIEVQSGARVDANRVVVDGNRNAGIYATGAGTVVEARDAAVTGTRPPIAGGRFGHGVVTLHGATVRLYGTTVQANRDSALVSQFEGSEIEAEDLVVTDTVPFEPSEMGGVALEVSQMGHIVGRRVEISRNGYTSVYALNLGSRIELEDALIEDTQASEASGPDVGKGAGVTIQEGASARLERCTIRGNREVGLVALSQGTDIEIADVVVGDTQINPALQLYGVGIVVARQAQLRGSGLVVRDNRTVGVYGDGTATRLDVDDLWIVGTKEDESGRNGIGMQLSNNVSGVLRRVLVENSGAAGVLMTATGYEMELADLTIRSTRYEASTLAHGGGLLVRDRARVALQGVVIADNRCAGILVSGSDTDLTMSDVLIRNTASCENDLLKGSGLVVQQDARASMHGALLLGNRQSGIDVLDEGSEASVTDVIVGETWEAACVELSQDESRSCVHDGARHGGGRAFGAFRGARGTIERFVLRDSDTCGFHVAQDGLIEARNGTIERNPIGANIRVEGYDLRLLANETTRYRDNGTNVDARKLALPSASEALDPFRYRGIFEETR